MLKTTHWPEKIMGWLLVAGLGFTACTAHAAAGEHAVYPTATEEKGAAKIAIAGIVLGTGMAEVRQYFAGKGLKPSSKTETILQYDKIPGARVRAKNIRLYFFNKKLYKVAITHSEEERDGYDVYHKVKAELVAWYGDDFEVLGDDAATVEAVAWRALHDDMIDLELMFQAVGKITTAAYIYKPLYKEFLASFMQ